MDAIARWTGEIVIGPYEMYLTDYDAENRECGGHFIINDDDYDMGRDWGPSYVDERFEIDLIWTP